MADRRWIVQRSWVTYQRDHRGVLVRTGHAQTDVCESLAQAAAHYNRAHDFLWVAPGQEEPDVIADAEVIALAAADPNYHAPARVPMPPDVAAAMAAMGARHQAPKPADQATVAPWIDERTTDGQ